MFGSLLPKQKRPRYTLHAVTVWRQWQLDTDKNRMAFFPPLNLVNGHVPMNSLLFKCDLWNSQQQTGEQPTAIRPYIKAAFLPVSLLALIKLERVQWDHVTRRFICIPQHHLTRQREEGRESRAGGCWIAGWSGCIDVYGTAATTFSSPIRGAGLLTRAEH